MNSSDLCCGRNRCGRLMTTWRCTRGQLHLIVDNYATHKDARV